MQDEVEKDKGLAALAATLGGYNLREVTVTQHPDDIQRLESVLNAEGADERAAFEVEYGADFYDPGVATEREHFCRGFRAALACLGKADGLR